MANTDEDFIKSLGGQLQTPSSSNPDAEFIQSLGGEYHSELPKDKSIYEKLYGHPFSWTEDVFGGFKPENTDGLTVKGGVAAGLGAVASLPASLIDMWRQATNRDPSVSLAGHLQSDIAKALGEDNPATAAAYRNLTAPLGAIDPQMAMPGSIPTAKMPKELRGVELPTPRIEPNLAKEVASFGGKLMENQSELPGGAGAFDNIRRQTSGEITPSADITNTPMERVTDSLLNGRDQAAVAGADQGATYAQGIDFWKQRADQMEAEARRPPEPLPQTPISVNEIGTAADPATMDALTRSTEGIQYESIPPGGSIPKSNAAIGMTVPKNVDPRWMTDENGIPVRQGLPTEPKNVPVQDMSSDTPHANDLGNAIQEANGPKLGPDETYGSGPIETSSPVFNSVMNGPGRSQRGSTDFFGGVDALVKVLKGTRNLVERATSSFENLAGAPLRKLTGWLPEDHMTSLPGQKDLIFKPDDGKSIVQQALAEGINKVNFPKNWQSGAIMAGEKFKSAALKGVGQWLSWLDKRTEYDVRENVKPIEKSFAKLPREEFQEVWKHFMNEDSTGTRALPSHLSESAQAAYTQLRKSLDDAWERSVKTREALGLPPVTKEEAYSAAMRHGDWKQSFYTKDGKLVYHVASTNRLAAARAAKWISSHISNIDIDRSKIEFAPELSGVGVPKDVISAWTKMQEWFGDSPEAQAIGAAIQKYNLDHGYTVGKYNERFLNKQGVPGFEGNKPWLSDKENSQNFFENQMKYLKDANRWNNSQEALSHLNEIVKNDELAKSQPNIMEYARKLVANKMGVSNNIWRKPEAELAKLLGISRTTLYHRIADIKTGTYLQMLGMSPGYMIATPLQGLIGVAMHRYLTNQGNSHQVMRTLWNTMQDTGFALARHYVHEMSGKDIPVPMTDLGKRALMYAEDNGIVSRNLTDEYQHLGSSKIMGAIKGALNPTIMTPEKVGRLSLFMSMVHHLNDVRNGLSEKEVFMKAEEFTDHAMTDMKPSARPMIVDKMGAAGELSYVFHSYLFNAAHQMALHGREAARGNPSGALAFLGSSAFLGGALALPLVNEADGIWNLFKEGVAKMAPQHYDQVSGLGIKGSIIKQLPVWAANGVISDALGANMSSRFAPNFVDPEQPLSGLAAPIQELKEQSAVANLAVNPTKRNAMQAAWVNSTPWGKGWMETHNDLFKNQANKEQGTQAYRKASNINDVGTDYKRTPNEETYRSMGLTANSEYKTRALRYINNKEQARVMEAFQGNFDRMQTRAFDGDKDGARKYAIAALRLIPDTAALDKMLSEGVQKYGMTPEERDKVHADMWPNLMKIKRVYNESPNK